LLAAGGAAAQSATPVGLWQTVNERGEREGLVRIVEANGELRGSVVAVRSSATRSGAQSRLVDDWEGFATREEAAGVRPGIPSSFARVSRGPSTDSLRAVTVLPQTYA